MVISTKENSLLSRNQTQTNDLNHLDFLQQKNLLKSLNQLIEKAGILGD